jgi:predicted TIM-barrel enzyme
MVLLKVMQTDGDTRLSLAHQGVGWIERVGMLRVAETLEAGSLRDATEDS